MSQLRTRSSIFAQAGLLLAGSLMLGLGGCAGFTPMYGAPGVSPKLSSIVVAQPDGRLGFFMHQYLNDALAYDSGEPSLYRLSVANREVRSAQGVTIASVASRYEVDLTTTYTLTEIATGKQVTTGRVMVNVTYDVVNQPYAALAAEQDGERRVAEQAADRIRLELASFFASPPPVAPTAVASTVPTFYSTDPDHQAVVIQTPREMATGVLSSGQNDVIGQPRQAVVTPDQVQPFNPSQDPNNLPNGVKDPSAIQTLPDAGGSGQ